MNKIKMNECMVDHVNSKIWVGNSYMKKASKYGTPEYNALASMRHDFPAYDVEIVRPKKATGKVSMKGLSYQYMDDHIRIHYGEESANYTEFQNRMKMKEGTHSHYMSMRKWFVVTYPNWKGDLEPHEEVPVKGSNGSAASAVA